MSFVQGLQLGLQMADAQRRKEQEAYQRDREAKADAWMEEQRAQQRSSWGREEAERKSLDDARERLSKQPLDAEASSTRVSDFLRNNGILVNTPDQTVTSTYQPGLPSHMQAPAGGVGGGQVVVPGRQDPNVKIQVDENSPEVQSIRMAAKFAKTPQELMAVQQGIKSLMTNRENAAVLNSVMNLDGSQLARASEAFTQSKILPGKAVYDDKSGITKLDLDGGKPIEMNKAQMARYVAGMWKLRSGDVSGYDDISAINKDLADHANKAFEQLKGVTATNNQAQSYIRADERQRQALDAAAGERSRARGESEAKAKAAVGLYKQNNPNASAADLEAVRRGVLDAVPKLDSNSPAEVKLARALVDSGMAGDMRSALEMAITKKGQDAGELHKELVTANVKNMAKPEDAVAQADKVMQSMGYNRQGGRWVMAGQTKPPGAAAKPKDQNDAHAQATAAISGGASKDAVNARLKELGYPPLP